MNSLLSQTFKRLFWVALLSIPFILFFHVQIVKSFFPLYDWALHFPFIFDDFNVVDLSIRHKDVKDIIEMKVGWKHVTFIGKHVIYPHPQGIATTSTMIWHALQLPFTAWMFMWAWPPTPSFHPPWSIYSIRIICLAPLLILAVAIDMPLFLYGGAWQIAYDAFSPGSENEATQWMFFAESGGHFVVGFFLALISITFGQVIQNRPFLWRRGFLSPQYKFRGFL